MNYSAKKGESTLFLNPMIGKISKIEETDGTTSTYKGVFIKCMYFMLMICVGIALSLYFVNTNALGVDAAGEIAIEALPVTLAFVSLGVFAIIPFIAFLIRVTIPVTGALYCIATGYILGFLGALDLELRGYLLLATVLTLSIVVVMGALFWKGTIRVTQKFRAVLYVLFSTMILGSFLMLIAYFIPGLRDGVMFLSQNPFISIGAGILGVVVASLFLLVDFDTIQKTVENRLPKKYEWFAAFGMIFTVVWLYFKVLDLLGKIQQAKN